MSPAGESPGLVCRDLGRRDYLETYRAMREFTQRREAAGPDEIWLLEHPRIFTQGQAGREEHLLDPGDIPVVQSNRGGQVTYHGPGQVVAYVLVDLHRRGIGIRDLVTRLELAMLSTLAAHAITAHARAEAPGVYVTRDDWPGAPGQPECRKIGSLGLRVSRGCSYHGLALNVAMDLEPFSRINPCGLRGMRMTQVSEFDVSATPRSVARRLGLSLQEQLLGQPA